MKKSNLIRMNVLVSPATKAKLDALRKQGTTASGFIRSLIEREFKSKGKPK